MVSLSNTKNWAARQAILVRRHGMLHRFGNRSASMLAQDAAEGSVLQILG